MEEINDAVVDFKAQHDSIVMNIESEQKALRKAQKEQGYLEEAQVFLQTISVEVQNKIHERVGGIVTSCLASVFAEPYEFAIVFEEKRGKTEGRFVLRRNGMELENPQDAIGGGVIDVAAFALRLACLMLVRPRLRHVLVLDEPFRFVSAGYREAVREMLIQLSEKFDIQFIVVTHMDELQTGKVVRI